MTEQEFIECKRKENSLYFWGSTIEFLARFINAALIGSAFTVLIIDIQHNGLLSLILNLLAIAILLLGIMGSKEIKRRWEFYFHKCAIYMGDKLREEIEKERSEHETEE